MNIAKSKPVRVYAVHVGGGIRLVEAQSVASAIRHVVKDTISAELATQRQMHECAAKDIEIEVAGAEE